MNFLLSLVIVACSSGSASNAPQPVLVDHSSVAREDRVVTAVELGDMKPVKLLALKDRGLANAWSQTVGKTPLHAATRTDSTELVQRLLDRGADSLAKDDLQRTPLGVATDAQTLQAIQRILSTAMRATEKAQVKSPKAPQ
jgi:ankyrin repeat protein